MFKRLGMFVVCLLYLCSLIGQPPLPNHGSRNNASVKQNSIIELDKNNNPVPVGTSTTLLLSLCIIFFIYKVRRNSSLTKDI